METIKEVEGRDSAYDFTTFQDKHYYGGFFNLALNNIELVFSKFRKKFKITGSKKVIDVIEQCFSDKISVQDFNNRIAFLKHYIPIVNLLDIESETERREKRINDELARRSYFKRNFILLFQTTSRLRNFYTHFYHEQIDVNPNFYLLLDELILKTVHSVKKHRFKTDETKYILKQSLEMELNCLLKLKKEGLKNKRRKGQKVDLSDESILNGVLNDVFKRMLFTKGNEKSPQLSFKFSSKINENDNFENNINISKKGLLFLLGLFLTKKESAELRSKVKGLRATIIPIEKLKKGESNLHYMATHWVLGNWPYKRANQKLSSRFEKERFLIQIADELSKVPDEVFQVLSEENKKLFIEDINEYVSDTDNGTAQELIIHPIIRKRYENKFNYFVIRFLDEFVDFPSLRFQVNLGSYVHDRKEEKKIEGTDYITDRIIKEKVRVFEKLSTTYKVKDDYFLKVKGVNDSGLERYPNPSYNFVGNNVPFIIDLIKSDVRGAKDLSNELREIRNEVQSEERNRNINAPINGKGKGTKLKLKGELNFKDLNKHNERLIFDVPLGMLSLNELPSILYELLVKKTSATDIENKIVEKILERSKIIKEYKTDEHQLETKVTRKLKKATDKEQMNTEKLLNSVVYEIHHTQDKLSELEEALEKNKNFSHTSNILSSKDRGRFSLWLANDIIKFMPISGRKQWKARHHNHLQNALAFFNFNSFEVISLLREFWDFDDKTFSWNNPLGNLLKHENKFVSLVKGYLAFRKDFYQELHNKIRESSEVNKTLEKLNVWNVFNKRKYVIRPLSEQKDKLLARPFVFPRGLFDQKPTYIKGESLENNPGLYADWFRYANCKTHQFQKFYTLSREYDDLYKSTPFTENKYKLSEQDRVNLFQRKQDKKIDKVKKQDLFLKLIFNNVFNQIFESDTDIQLPDFYLTKQQRRRMERESEGQSQRTPGDTSANYYREDFIWNKTFVYQMNQIFEPRLKLKDLGKFNYLLQDIKVKQIFEYDPRRIWSKDELEKELYNGPDSYEVLRRDFVLKAIQNIEERILKYFNFDGKNQPYELANGEVPNFNKYISKYVEKRYNKIINKEDLAAWLSKQNSIDLKVYYPMDEFDRKDAVIKCCYLLIYLRNKFAHNQMPNKAVYDMINLKIPNNSQFSTYARQIYTFLESIITFVFNEEKGLK